MILSSQIIKQQAHLCGFGICGIAKQKQLTLEKERFKKSISQNLHAQKSYLERDIDKRFHPELLLDNCKSVVVCGFNYNIGNIIRQPEERLKISKYAQIKDYHIFVKEKLEKLAKNLQEIYGVFKYKTTVDSSVISEKSWAVQAGIGYYGKNGVIQTPLGSFVFFGTLLIAEEADSYDAPNQNSCKNCSKCITACPTNAIVAPYQIDCKRCISHITLDKKETDFSDIAKYGWIVGCDECQIICPNNTHAPVNEDAVALKAPFFDNKNEILTNLSPDSFELFFKDTAIYKLKYEGLKRRVECSL